MSDEWPKIRSYIGGFIDDPITMIEIVWRRDGQALDLPTAIRLRDRLTQAIDAAQAPTSSEPTEPASPANPGAAT
jgi:hypothetical protein